jgi:hypothetical protein
MITGKDPPGKESDFKLNLSDDNRYNIVKMR